jgi:Xaa-Pro aminopeptidase
MILVGDEHYQGHVRYLSDYRPMLEAAVVLLGKEREPVLLCGPECKVLAYQTSRIKDIRVCSDVAIPGEEYPNETMQGFKEILLELEKAAPIRKVGIVNLDLVPQFIMTTISDVCRGKEIVNASRILDELRGIKSKSEIQIMKRVYAMGLEGLRRGLEAVQIGKRETDILAEMAQPPFAMGAELLSHCFYAAAGKGTSPALYFSRSDRRIEDGDLVLLDIGAVYNGYFSDVATTRICGKKTPEKQRVIDTVRRALEAATKVVRPGVMGKQIDRAAREITSAAGYERNHLYGAVHGVGLQHCEYPFFGPTTEVRVEEGMFFNIDIGLFNFDFGGVRLENGYLVTANGCEMFSVRHE